MADYRSHMALLRKEYSERETDMEEKKNKNRRKNKTRKKGKLKIG